MTSMQIMGILNITPDSFSDGGKHFEVQAAVDQAGRMIHEGADILDIGGESTRPFADPVTTEHELKRVIPVIQGIRRHHSIPISIDTSKALVAREALDAGADIINDISALRNDKAMLEVVKSTRAPVIIMHMQGTPGDMQIDPQYSDVVSEVIDFFQERLDWLVAEGVERQRITIDPGIGFGKKLQHNLSLLKHLDKLKELNQPLLLGHSRKRFMGDITGLEAEERDLPTAVISGMAVTQGVDILRVHNVAATQHAINIAEAINNAS